MHLPSMANVAARAGVSKNTVSLCLRNSPQIPRATRDRIRRLADEMGYRKNAGMAELMSKLRTGQIRNFQATLGLLNAHVLPDAFKSHPTVPTYVEGCRRRAEQQGYALDEFWLHDPALDGARLNRILRNRGIRGLVVVGLMDGNRLPERFQATWENFPASVTGVRTCNPALSFACTDHHALVLRAMENLLRLGYRRPALVIDPKVERVVEGRFTAGYLIAQRNLPDLAPVAPFYLTPEVRRDPGLFHHWLRAERPDAVLTLYSVVRRWVENAGLRVPRDIGLVQLEWRRNQSEWAGMDQHNDITGEAAVEMVIHMIHQDERGIPAYPRATLIGNTWVDGSTVRVQRPGRPAPRPRAIAA